MSRDDQANCYKVLLRTNKVYEANSEIAFGFASMGEISTYTGVDGFEKKILSFNEYVPTGKAKVK
jgi:hypothetical protein